MKAKHLHLLLAAALLFAGCQKDLDGPQKETKNKLQWKWQVESIEIDQNIGNTHDIKTLQSTPDDYVDFRNDGKMYTFFNGTRDTSAYEIKNDKTITINGDAATIRTLTDHTFVLFSKDQAGSIGYLSVTYNLKR